MISINSSKVKKKKTNWRVYERDHIYLETFFVYFDLISLKPSRNLPYMANYYEIISFQDGYFWWARDVDLLEKTMRKWVNQWLENDKKLKEIISLFKKSRNRLLNTMPGLKLVNLKDLDNKELYDYYINNKSIFFDDMLFSEYTVDLFDDFFANIFEEKLQQLSHNEITLSDLGGITRSAYISSILEYKKKVIELSFKKIVTNSQIQGLVERYYWIVMSWDGTNELTSKRILSDLKKIKNDSKESRKKQLVKINNFKKDIYSTRNKLIKKYNLSKKTLAKYFQLLDLFTMHHDWRKEIQMKCIQINCRISKEISKRFKIKYSDILYYYSSEIKDLCLKNKKIPILVIKKRRTSTTLVVRNGNVKIFEGNQASKIFDRLVLSEMKTKKVKKVTGIPVSRGKIKGRVFIAKSAREAVKKMRKGDILITSMTTVDYLMAMQKARAIITDDGGVTCHAAIVSRELNKPCIVGTKISTKVFKTGDRVEIDAEKGIIKLVK